jgi:hypothetical protein
MVDQIKRQSWPCADEAFAGDRQRAVTGAVDGEGKRIR